MKLKASEIIQQLFDMGYVKKIVWSFDSFAITTFELPNHVDRCVVVHGVAQGEFTNEALEVAGHPIDCLNTGTMFKATNLKEEFTNADHN